MAFQSADSMRFPPRLVVGVEGPTFTGKTHFLFTATRPLKVFNLDYGLEGMMEQFRKPKSGISLDGVEIANYSLNRAALTTQLAQDKARSVVQEFVRDFRAALAVKTRTTLAEDTSSDFWKYFRFADLGKLKQVPPMRYDRVNMLWADLHNEVYHSPHNLILIHRVKDKYREEVVDGVKVSNKIAGETERDAFKNVEYLVQVFIRTWRRDRGKGKPPVFGFTVTKCRHRASVVGEEFEGEFATFPMLATSVFPKTEIEDWA